MTTYLPYRLDEEGNKVVDFGVLEELGKVE
jgi:hypothetical protein